MSNVRVTIELGEYSSRIVRILNKVQGGTLTSACKAMVDLGAYYAEDRVNQMCAALAPPGVDVKSWQDQLLSDESDLE